MPEITIEDRNIPYSIRKSRRAKHVNLRIVPELGLEVVVPARYLRKVDVESILFERSNWILKHIDRMQTLEGLAQDKWRAGSTILHFGREVALHVNSTERKYPKVHFENNIVWVEVPELNQSESALVRDAIQAWHHKLAKNYIPDRVEVLANLHGFEYGTVRIRNQKTRWGSCSTRKNLNFNQRLIMCPVEVIDYVILHELCHLREMNHSAKFWAEVERLCPDYPVWQEWLKKNSNLLRY